MYQDWSTLFQGNDKSLNLTKGRFIDISDVFRVGALHLVPKVVKTKAVPFLIGTTFRAICFGYNHSLGRVPFLPGGPLTDIQIARNPFFYVTTRTAREVCEADERTDLEKRNRLQYTTRIGYYTFYIEECPFYYLST